MKNLYVSTTSPLAITYNKESMLIECWHTPKRCQKNLRIFVDKKGKKRILASDQGYRWHGLSTFAGFSGNGEIREAANCFYGTLWFGDYPYGSWCIAIRICKYTRNVSYEFFDTEINCRGRSPVDRWSDDCRSYVPSAVAA